ncbi:tripartite tricarboxylate transporter permease [Billgrantia endophytica]|uniref:DUF112 domain-containing protein n=1 Tax=Billgrantia endophytica TaxID=2033802 RepID=A0A2N7U7S1_9GAMM|nr:tripartite tricarboxylate transporter permease [Halomonas endophytica]PMR76475.1 hypothetical protein C1H69_05375 [Halomonas endophytica]
MDNLLASLALGAGTALALSNVLYCFLGVMAGTFIGVLPGIGPLAAISMLLPITFYLEPAAAIIMLAGVYYGAEYGGSITSILLNLPGTTSSAVTCLDGYPLSQQGRASMALFMTAMASFLGSTVGILAMILFSPLLARFALDFGPWEYFSVMLLGLICAAVIASGSAIKGLMMVALGLLLGTVGTDVNSGTLRYTFGMYELFDGIDLIVLAMGLFGIAEVFFVLRHPADPKAGVARVSLREMLPHRSEMRRSPAPVLRGSILGSLVGALPGTGQTVAAYLSYALEKLVSRRPEKFGSGAIEGIMAPESANNAAAQTAFIPTLVLGIPGSATMALILGALMIHGISPGSALMNENSELFWGLIMSFWVGNVLLLVLNVPLIRIWVAMLGIRREILHVAIVCFICVGVYTVNHSPLDILFVLAFGIVGYAFKLAGFQPAPLLVGFILGPMMEEQLRRAMLLSGGDLGRFIERPISATVLAIALALTLLLMGRQLVALRSRKTNG